jgi:uncharacterized membrane protein
MDNKIIIKEIVKLTVMNKIKAIDGVALLASILPFVFWIFVRDMLNEQIPIHWNSSGEVDGWAAKDQMPLFLSMMMVGSIAAYLILRFITKLDPKRTAFMNQPTALKIGLAIVILISTLSVLILLPKSSGFNIAKTVLILVSVLFALQYQAELFHRNPIALDP